MSNISKSGCATGQLYLLLLFPVALALGFSGCIASKAHSEGGEDSMGQSPESDASGDNTLEDATSPPHDDDVGNSRNCTNDEFLAHAGTEEESCQALTICELGQFEVAEATATTDRVCQDWTECGQEEFEAEAPTEKTDRLCVNLSVCGPGEFELLAPTATSDRGCERLSECRDGKVAINEPAEDGSALQGRICCVYLEMDLRRDEDSDWPDETEHCLYLRGDATVDGKRIPKNNIYRIDGSLTLTNLEEDELLRLSALRILNGDLHIEGNTSLESLEGLEGTQLEGSLFLVENAKLEDITALSHIESLPGKFLIGGQSGA